MSVCGFPNGYRTIERSSSIALKPMWIMFFKLMGQLSKHFRLYNCLFVNFSKGCRTATYNTPLNSKHMWILSFQLQIHYRLISNRMHVYVWMHPMTTERLYDAIRRLQGRFVHSSESFKIMFEAFQFGYMFACGCIQWLYTNCTKQLNCFKTCAAAILKAFNPMSKHTRWCQCLCVSSTYGNRTIVRNRKWLQDPWECCSWRLRINVETFQIV